MLKDYKLSLKEMDYILKRISDTINKPFYGEIYIRKPYENSISYALHACYNLEDFIVVFNLGKRTDCDLNDLSDWLKEIILERYEERINRNGK